MNFLTTREQGSLEITETTEKENGLTEWVTLRYLSVFSVISSESYSRVVNKIFAKPFPKIT